MMNHSTDVTGQWFSAFVQRETAKKEAAGLSCGLRPFGTSLLRLHFECRFFGGSRNNALQSIGKDCRDWKRRNSFLGALRGRMWTIPVCVRYRAILVRIFCRDVAEFLLAGSLRFRTNCDTVNRRRHCRISPAVFLIKP